MISNLFKLLIITPEKTIYENDIQSLIIPSELGFLGILSHHAPLVANLVPGKITIKDKYNSKRFFNSNSRGTLEILDNAATVIVDSIEEA